MFGRKKEEKFELTIDELSIEVTRKKIKNIYLRVNRNSGKIRVSVPVRISNKELERFISSKYTWILKHKIKAESTTKKDEIEYVSGDVILFQGKNYELNILEGEGTTNIEIIDDNLILTIKGRSVSTVKERKNMIEKWYRTILLEQISSIIKKYEPIMGVQVKEYRVKKMKTRWGTCNIRDCRIWLNLELVKKSEGALEMVVVHEMVHLLERLHNKRFYGLMDTFMPQWRFFNDELKSMID